MASLSRPLLPAETNKRLVLLSDGGENAGAAQAAARLAAARGVPLSYVDLGAPPGTPEALIAELHAPAAVRAGQSFELTVKADELEELAERFHAAHEQRYGYAMRDEPVELVNLRLVAIAPVEKPELREPPPPGEDPVRGQRRVSVDGEWREIDVFDRARMGEGSKVAGPAIVELAEATCYVRPGWAGRVDAAGTLVLERK